MAIGAGQQRTENFVQRHDQVVETLKRLAIPMTPRVLALVMKTWKGAEIDARAVTTLCRRDRKTWHPNTSSQEQELLTPALDHELAQPIHALVTVSTWPLSSRIVTPHSPRSDHANLVLALIDAGVHAARRGDDTGPRLWTLAGQLARGIPGAATYSGLDSTRDALRRAATVEVKKFADIVSEEREAAAKQFAAYDRIDLTWGRCPETDDPA